MQPDAVFAAISELAVGSAGRAISPLAQMIDRAPWIDSAGVIAHDCPSGLPGMDGEPFVLYAPTAGERAALDWIGGRYLVGEAIRRYCLPVSFDPETGLADWLIDVEAVREALRDEGLDRVPCLSEDTGLARLVWAWGPAEPEPPARNYTRALARRVKVR